MIDPSRSWLISEEDIDAMLCYDVYAFILIVVNE